MMNQQQNAISLARVTSLNDCRLDLLCLTNGFNVDRACCDTDVRDNVNTTVRQMLRTDQLQISCRTQKWCHHHVLSAAEKV
jgi:hypothetical protein